MLHTNERESVDWYGQKKVYECSIYKMFSSSLQYSKYTKDNDTKYIMYNI